MEADFMMCGDFYCVNRAYPELSFFLGGGGAQTIMCMHAHQGPILHKTFTGEKNCVILARVFFNGNIILTQVFRLYLSFSPVRVLCNGPQECEARRPNTRALEALRGFDALLYYLSLICKVFWYKMGFKNTVNQKLGGWGMGLLNLLNLPLWMI